MCTQYQDVAPFVVKYTGHSLCLTDPIVGHDAKQSVLVQSAETDTKGGI